MKFEYYKGSVEFECHTNDKFVVCTGKESCWYKVAWAFLRPIGVDGTDHVNKLVRLQLYRPKKTFIRMNKKTKCEVSFFTILIFKQES